MPTWIYAFLFIIQILYYKFHYFGPQQETFTRLTKDVREKSVKSKRLTFINKIIY